MTSTAQNFAQNMKSARDSRGWSQAELSRRLKDAGLSQFHPTTVARIEKGERQIRLDEAPVIGHAFGATVDQMMLPADGFREFLEYMKVATNAAHCKGQMLAWARKYRDSQVAINRYLNGPDGERRPRDEFARARITTEQIEALEREASLNAWEVVRDEPPF